MALLDIFKNKNTEEKKEKKDRVQKEKKIQAVKPKKTEKKEEVKIEPRKSRKKTPGRAYHVLQHPHITEKATVLTEENKYVFEVWPRANKSEIAKTVEEVYGVDVTGVRIINMKGKQKRMGKTLGWKKGYKKAIIEIKEGQKIEVLPR
jgi:large subunit ribosomal protein L23